MAATAPARVASAKPSAVKTAGKGGAGTTPDEQEAKGKGGKKKLILIVLILVIAGVAGKFLLMPSGPKKPAAPKPGPVVQLDEMTVNLAGGHFLRLQVAIETVAGSKPIEENAKAQQDIITVFSDRKMTDLAGETARNAAKDELVKLLQKDYPKQVMDVYYTAFVMQ